MTKIDRTGWPKGEWDSEPDRVEWRVDDFYCLIARMPHSGHLNGYVGVTDDHRWHLKDYDDIEALYAVEVHGGITFANHWRMKEDNIPDHLWLVGFDTAHCDDWRPNPMGMPQIREGFCVYRNLQYVIGNVRSLLQVASGNRKAERVWLIEGEPHLCYYGLQYPVIGDGAEMLRQWVRFGNAHLGVIADWLEENTNAVKGPAPVCVSEVANLFRSEATV